jgi:phosphatidylglycerophosphate synthase
MAKTKTFTQFVVIHYILLVHVAATSLPDGHALQPWAVALMDRSIVDTLMIATALFTLVTGILYLFSNRTVFQQNHG